MHAHTIIANGVIHPLTSGVTPVAAAHLVDALAIAHGRILAVGQAADLDVLLGPFTKVIDVGGRAVLPAFVDSHTHFRRAAIARGLHLDFQQSIPGSLADVLAAVAERADVRAPGEWVEGDNLDVMRLAERRYPKRDELDHAAPRHPVVLRSVGRHVVAANSRALAAARIDETTPDPAGGRIDRDDRGVPTGVLHEQGKLRLDNGAPDSVIPKPCETQRLDALRAGIRMLHEHGIAGIHEMAREPDDVADYQRLREAGDLRVRVRLYERGLRAATSLEHVLATGLRTGFGDDWLRFGGVKFSIDGSETARNAAVYDPYPGQPSNIGVIRIDEDELAAALRAAHHAGLEACVHAIGPRAVDIALNAFEYAIDVPDPRLHHRIEHAYLPARAGQLARMAALGLTLSTQPGFLWEFGDTWREVFGDDRVVDALPLRGALNAGIPLLLNSDFPCTPIAPFRAIGAAVTRVTQTGWVVPGDQAISAEQAFRAMTSAGRSTASLDGGQALLSPGALADVIVTDRDPLTCAAESIAETTVLLTMVGGDIVHDRLA